MTGVYVGIYFLAHLTAVLGARYAGTDTNWNWLTNNDHSMLASLSNLRLIAHYWFGPIVIATHLGCGVRLVLRVSRHSLPILRRGLRSGLEWLFRALSWWRCWACMLGDVWSSPSLRPRSAVRESRDKRNVPAQKSGFDAVGIRASLSE
jgi:hypothetical protein